MATPYKVVIGPKDIGNFHVGGYNEAAAAKVSEVLQHNLENWDILFIGPRHNHIVHCILTIFALGATPEEIQKVYDREKSYQKRRDPIDEEIVKSLANNDEFQKFLDRKDQYSNYLLFFQRQIEAKGVRALLEEYLFAETKLSNQVLARVYASVFHPYLHLGYAFEFNQPAIVAEALAMACVHCTDSPMLARLLLEAEAKASGPRQRGRKTLRELLQEVRTSDTLRKSIDGADKIDRSMNVAHNAANEMIKYASQYSISGDQLEERLDEMVDTCSLFIAVKPSPLKDDERYKIDFFMLHSVNMQVLNPSLVHHDWISQENAIRMLEWAGRCNMMIYVAQTAPPITPAEIDRYPPKRSWSEIFSYSINHPTDDGHMQKCVRSLAFGEKYLSSKHTQGALLIKPESWLRFANFVVDKVPLEARTSAERWLLSF